MNKNKKIIYKNFIQKEFFSSKNNKKINKIDNKFSSFLKSLMGKRDIKIKVRIEINKYKICLTRRIREYSVPIRE